ncbi:hypothetical protein ACFSZT_06935 [Prauserella oleivorans]|uniref:hypothetical protein n=1 Tax=Prauserella oleivorans TaxID=1478153 RepID=UPI00362E1A63
MSEQRKVKPRPGRWMVAEQGSPRQGQHYVLIRATPWYASDGWLMGWVAACGVRCIEATDAFRARYPVCTECESVATGVTPREKRST